MTGEVNDESDYSDFSMLDLFRMEVSTQVEILNKGLLDLEYGNSNPDLLAVLMRSAHSIKGAARMVSVNSVVRISHIVEDCFVAVQSNELSFSQDDIDIMLASIDQIQQISRLDDNDIIQWDKKNEDKLQIIEQQLELIHRPQVSISKYSESHVKNEAPELRTEKEATQTDDPSFQAVNEQTNIRVAVERLDKMYSLSGKALVESHQLSSVMPEFWQVKQRYQLLISQLNRMQESISSSNSVDDLKNHIKLILVDANKLRHQYGETIAKLDAIDRRSSTIIELLNREIVSSRMRPISEILNGLPRMVRDLGRSLGKNVRLQMSGLSTLVDRHVLEKIDTPIKHLVQNAIDHGIEAEDVRQQLSKNKLATLKLSVTMSGGMLQIVLEDDGRGVDFDLLKSKIIERNIATEIEIKNLDDNALLDFLFYPGFSTRANVSQISGRGVGLDLVKDTVVKLNGNVHASSVFGEGSRFQLILPVTVSVLRVMLVTIGGESYSFPISIVEQLMSIDSEHIKHKAGRNYIEFDGKDLHLVHANSIFEKTIPEKMPQHLEVLVLNGTHKHYAVVVEKSNGEQELSIQNLSIDLGKVTGISSAAILNSGALTLIIDAEEYFHSIEILQESAEALNLCREETVEICKVIAVLVVDDSITVRETERQLLRRLHYSVSVAEDGLEALQKMQNNAYDFLVTDIDMPNMDGLRLINEIRYQEKYANLPILVVSNRERAFIEQSVILDDRTCFYEKDTFSPAGFVQAVQNLVKMVDTYS